MADPIQFRIYPSKDRNLFYTVFIFKRKRHAQGYIREQNKLIGCPDTQGDFLAITRGWTSLKVNPDGTDGETGRDIGQIVFCEKACRVGIVSHEMTHATIFWAKRMRKPFKKIFNGGDENPEHEEFCWVQGNLVRQFWVGWWKHHPNRK